jgi:hypothetical protein
MYSEFAIDPKVQMMSEADQRRFIMVLCLRCSNEHVTLQDEEIAFQLRISNEQWAATKAVFIAKELINQDNTPTAWDKRQFVSDSSAERVAKHRAKKKKACNVTVTPPEAEADTDTDTDKNPTKERCANPEVVKTADTAIALAAAPTRKGEVCGLLRKAGMQDAAPHYLTDQVWDLILAKRTNEEITEFARAKMAANPGKRIGLKYLAPGLLEDSEPIAANSRASPAKRQTLTETRTQTIAELTGRNRNHERTVANERDITGESVRVA